jgi:hypothetical protein
MPFHQVIAVSDFIDAVWEALPGFPLVMLFFGRHKHHFALVGSLVKPNFAHLLLFSFVLFKDLASAGRCKRCGLNPAAGKALEALKRPALFLKKIFQ